MSEATKVPMICDGCGGTLADDDAIWSSSLGIFSHINFSQCISSLGERLALATKRAEAAEAEAERDALRKDAARLDWLADTVAIEAFGIDDVDADVGCVGMDIYEHASVVADERGNDDDLTVSDQREGFRRMIDASMAVQP